MRLAVAVAGWLAVTGAVMWMVGLLVPNFEWDAGILVTNPQVGADGVLFDDIDITVRNNGMFPVTITGLTADMPGLRVVAKTPVTVREWTSVKARVYVSDCSAVPYEPQPVHFSYRTPLVPGATDTTWNSRQQVSDSEEPFTLAWQRSLASSICNEAMKPEWP